MKRLTPIGLLLLLTACVTAPIQELHSPVPPGLSRQDIQAVILFTLGFKEEEEQPPPNWEMILDRGLDAALWRYQSPFENGWDYESATPTRVIGIYRNDDTEWVKVAIDYDTSHINTHIIASEGLRQSSGSIHKSAMGWVRHLESAIQRNLAHAAILRSRKTPEKT